jgi:putative acetyltransferase
VLVRAGLDVCRARHDLVVVLGHPGYYPRFGFVVAAAHGLTCEYPSPPEAFMVVELRPGALSRARGLVRYRPEFAGV